MKKIIATLLLLIFTSNIATFAGEVIIVSSDGQARYEKEDLNTEVVKSAVSNLNKESNSITTEHPQKGEVVAKDDNQEVKINIKDLDKKNPDIIKYHNKFYKYSRKEVSDFYTSNINKELKGYKYYNYSEKDNFNINDKNIIRVELQDGDYAILNNNIKGKKKYKYAAEYHKDGSLFGIVQIKTIKKTRESATLAFYEYRQNEDCASKFSNKHIMILDVEKKKDRVNVAQFIYKHHVNLNYLICCQINNNLYLNEESKNLIVKMKKINIPSESYDNAKETLTESLAITGYVLATPLIVSAIVIGVPLFFIGLMIFGFDHH